MNGIIGTYGIVAFAGWWSYMQSKKEKTNPYARLLQTSWDLIRPGSLGGLSSFVRARICLWESTREIGARFGDLTQTPKTTFSQPAHARHGFRYRRTMSGGYDRSEDAKDAGKEFYNKPFQALMKRKNIHHSPLVERKTVSRSVFTVRWTLTFLPVLQDLVLGYRKKCWTTYTWNAWSPNEIEIRLSCQTQQEL